MAEIKTAPVAITIDDTEYAAFDEDHTLGDIARWVMENRADGEELHRILGEMLE